MTDIKIRLIRHAETESNVGKFKGKNSRLTENGINQSSRLTGEYDLVICSTLWRTREYTGNQVLT